MNQRHVTVVIPTKNRVNLLRTTLRTILAQRSVEFETVIIDDGSTPENAAAVGELEGETVRIIRNNSSRGAAAARNQGIMAAGAPLVAFCDDDDLWTPGKLESQVAAMTDAKTDWAYTGAVKFEEGPTIWQYMPAPSPEQVHSELATRNIIPAGASNVIADRRLLEDVGGFDEDLSHLADWDLWLRLLDHSMPAAVPAISVGYRLHPEAMSMNAKAAILELETLDRRWRHLRGGEALDPGPTHLWIAMGHLRGGHRGRAMLSYIRAIRHRPGAGFRGALRTLHPHPPRPSHVLDEAGDDTSRFKRVERVVLPEEMSNLLAQYARSTPAEESMQ